MLTFMSPYSKILAERIAEKKKKIYLYVCGLLFMLISCITKKKECVAFTLKRVPINIKNMGV